MMSDEPIWRRYLRFRGRDIDADVEEELRFHLEMHEQELREAGFEPERARAEAEAAFGDVGEVRSWLRRHDRHRQRLADRARGVGHLMLDLRYAIRSLGLQPVPSLILVATLAIGIGTATVMFSIIDAILLRPLPFREPDQLVDVMQVQADGGANPYLPFEDVQVWRERRDVFTDVVGTIRTTLLFTGGTEPRTLPGLLVEPNFTRVLGVEPILGRSFREADGAVGAQRVVLIDHDFWRGTLGGDPAVLGRHLELENERYEIIGVMPRDFRFPLYSTTDFWLPISRDGSTPMGQSATRLSLVGRLADKELDVASARAAAAATALQESLPREQGWGISFERIERLRLSAFGPATNGEWILIGSVLMLVMASAANAAGLLLTRSWARTREFGLRVALGSSRARLVRLAVLESLLIGVAATLLGGLISLVQLRLIRDLVPTEVIFFAPFKISLGPRTVVATFLFSLAVALLISVPSALRATRLAQLSARGGLTRYAALTPASSRTRRTLLYMQVTLSVVLLVGAVLLGNSYRRLLAADPGQRIRNVAVLQLSLPPSNYPSGADRAAFISRLVERLEGLPGVERALIGQGVGTPNAFMFGVELETSEGPLAPSLNPQILPYTEVDPDFFEAFEVRILAGRAFVPEDAGTDNVIVNSHLAGIIAGGGGEAIGTQFRTGPESPWRTIVGVVPEMRLMGPDDRRAPATMIHPRQPDRVPGFTGVSVLTRSDPRSLFPAIRAAVRQTDPEQPIEDLRLARDFYMEEAALPRFLFAVTAILSAVALCVVVIGIHGLLSYQITQRRPEFGVRIALGASQRRLSWEVARSGIGIVFLAVASGVAIASALSGVIRNLLYGVAPNDWRMLALVGAVVLGSAVVATVSPARRAWRTEPARVLRIE